MDVWNIGIVIESGSVASTIISWARIISSSFKYSKALHVSGELSLIADNNEVEYGKHCGHFFFFINSCELEMAYWTSSCMGFKLYVSSPIVSDVPPRDKRFFIYWMIVGFERWVSQSFILFYVKKITYQWQRFHHAFYKQFQ